MQHLFVSRKNSLFPVLCLLAATTASLAGCGAGSDTVTANIAIDVLDTEATATALAQVTTTSGSNTLTNVSVSSGALAVGQVLAGPGIPAGTTITSIPTASSVVMSAPATVTGIIVAVAANYPAAASATAATTTGSNTLTITLLSAGALAAGQVLMGSGIPAGTTITSIPIGASVVMSAPATATAVNVAVAALKPQIVLPVCGPSGNLSKTFTVTVVDVNGNAMPAGTTVNFATTNGVITSPATYIPSNTPGCRTGYAGCVAGSATFGDIPVTMKSDANTTPCNNPTPSGTFTVTVTAPTAAGTTTTTFATANVTD